MGMRVVIGMAASTSCSELFIMSLQHHICTALLVIASLFAAVPAQAALDNKGTEFIFGFLPNHSSATIELYLTSDVACTVDVYYPSTTLLYDDVVISAGQ